MLVGQAPGKTEMRGGPPFSGRAGVTLFRWFARVGFEERDVRELLYIAAVTRCFPGSHPSGRGDRVPTRAEQERCADWLAEEIAIVRPSVVIPVGRLAIERFLAPAPLSALVGRSHVVTLGERRVAVIPLPHPSGASSWIHAPGHAALVDDALQLIAERLRPPLPIQGAA